jgi:hypothetical protein
VTGFVPGGGFIDPAHGFQRQLDADTVGEGDKVKDKTVAEVLDWVGSDVGRAQVALEAERDGQNRSTLVTELENRLED